MKTNQEIKSEVINYLKKSSNHLFQIGNDEHKIIIHNDYYIRITGKYVVVNDINKMIEYYVNNTKNVIKHSLFLSPSYGYNIKTIPYYKSAREKYKNINDALIGKTELKDITDIIKKMI
jgi:hypothetical protein